MKFIILLISFFSSLASAELIDLNFDQLRNCTKTEFNYEKIFLMDGRTENQKLVLDPFATQLILNNKLIPSHYEPVTVAYSIPLFENYVNFSEVNHFTKTLAIAVVKDTTRVSNGGFQEFEGYPLEIILFAADEGSSLAGLILGQHPARIRDGNLETFNFSCSPM